MGSRGSRKKSKRRDVNKETTNFIESIENDQGISDMTRKDLIADATKNLQTFQTAEKDFKGGIAGAIDRSKATETFDSSASELRRTLDQAREGTAPKFRARQMIEKKRAFLADRPGQRGTALTRR